MTAEQREQSIERGRFGPGILAMNAGLTHEDHVEKGRRQAAILGRQHFIEAGRRGYAAGLAKLSPERRSDLARNATAKLTPEQRIENSRKGGLTTISRHGWNCSNSWARGGYREDIGLYVRSSWEANFARYLNLLVERGDIMRWEYEPRRFYFSGIKRGTTSYLPDFCLFFRDGHYEWVEIKGYMTPKSKTAIKRFLQRYPDEILVIIDRVEYKRIKQEFGSAIPEWEK